MNQKFIVIDGKTYKSVDEMPEDVRTKYENAMQSLDQNQNGIPDVFENSTPIQGTTFNVTSATKIIVNGQTYDSLDQLPPELRAKYEQALNSMDANHNGVPDFLEGMMKIPNQNINQTSANFGITTPPPSQPIPVGSTMESESSRRWLPIISGVILIGVCLVAGAVVAWYFFLR